MRRIKSAQSLFLLSFARFSFHDYVFAYRYTNIYGGQLRSCSTPGMALTGYTHSGYCFDNNDQEGSHHVCVDVSSENGANYCAVTSEVDWCSYDMPCHPDGNAYQNDDGGFCQVQNWCICHWAFASYLEEAGGCSNIQDLVCDAINMEAVKAYQNRTESKYKEALQCIEKKCGISFTSTSSMMTAAAVGLIISICVVAAVTLVFRYFKIKVRIRLPPKKEPLNPVENKESDGVMT